jgi:hypothetical protein
MISWIIIVGLIIFGIFAIKTNHLRHRFFIIIFVLLVLFFYTTFYIVSTKNQLDFTNAEGVFSAVKIYTGWLANGFNNMRSITGNAVNMDWTNTNASFFAKKQAENKAKTTAKTQVKK